MTTNPERCNQLRTLHSQLVQQIRVLRESVQKVEQEGVDAPVESINVIKSLEKSLRNTALELQECPPETSEVSSASLQQQSTTSPTAETIRRWFPDSHQGEDDEGDTIIDEY